jgi:deoxyribose-phosphate aldolase
MKKKHKIKIEKFKVILEQAEGVLEEEIQARLSKVLDMLLDDTIKSNTGLCPHKQQKNSYFNDLAVRQWRSKMHRR